jgi:glycosyltransferase involved in cell wall biosynthesis
VLQQGYPNLEYIIIDGGSTDNSVEIIKKFSAEKHLSYWVSEPDNGQYDAINKGFSRATGEIMAWLNSDDMYVPGTFRTVAEIFNKFEFVNWITGTPTTYTIHGSMVAGRYHIYSRDLIKRGFYGPIGSWIQQEGTFWRRELWEKAGGRMNASYDYAGDFELWQRFSSYDYLYTVNAVLGGFRHHPNQKTKTQMDKYYEEISETLSNKRVKRIKLKLYNRFIRYKLFYFNVMHNKQFKNFIFKKNIPFINYSFRDNDWVCYFDERDK